MENYKICPRCHETLNARAKFCSNCGWKFGSPKRRWKEKSFQDVSFQEVMNWLKNYNGNIEISSVRGNIRYNSKGFIFVSRDWYVQYLTIRYYDDDKANKSYALVYDEQYDSLFKDGGTKAINNCEARISGRNTVFKIVRKSHYTGGDSKMYCCAMAIYEI